MSYTVSNHFRCAAVPWPQAERQNERAGREDSARGRVTRVDAPFETREREQRRGELQGEERGCRAARAHPGRAPRGERHHKSEAHEEARSERTLPTPSALPRPHGGETEARGGAQRGKPQPQPPPQQNAREAKRRGRTKQATKTTAAGSVHVVGCSRARGVACAFSRHSGTRERARPENARRQAAQAARRPHIWAPHARGGKRQRGRASVLESRARRTPQVKPVVSALPLSRLFSLAGRKSKRGCATSAKSSGVTHHCNVRSVRGAVGKGTCAKVTEQRESTRKSALRVCLWLFVRAPQLCTKDVGVP